MRIDLAYHAQEMVHMRPRETDARYEYMTQWNLVCLSSFVWPPRLQNFYQPKRLTYYKKAYRNPRKLAIDAFEDRLA